MSNKSELLKKKKELQEQLKDTEKQLIAIKEIERQERMYDNEKKIENLRENKELILKFIEHDRTSCSDKNPCNGYGSAEYGARCSKCHLIEILEGQWGNEFEVSFDVLIDRFE